MKDFNMQESDWERFWDKVNRKNNTSVCWEWKAATTRFGHGRFKLNGKLVSPHRIIWSQVNGKSIPKDMDICHHCDNPACVNPDHLFIGTRSDNMNDASRKGRLNPRDDEETKEELREWSERLGKKRRGFSKEEVHGILKRYYNGESSRSLGDEFDVAHSTILKIKNGEYYSEIVENWKKRHKK